MPGCCHSTKYRRATVSWQATHPKAIHSAPGSHGPLAGVSLVAESKFHCSAGNYQEVIRELVHQCVLECEA